MAENADDKGFITQLLADMPPKAKALLMWFLMFPIALAISGMLLQVNIGAIIQGTLLQSRGETVDIVGTMLTSKFASIDARLASMEQAVNARDKTLTVLTTRIDGVNTRLDGVEAEVRQLRDWACDNDSARGLGECAVPVKKVR